MTLNEIEMLKAAGRIDMQVFKNLENGEYLLIWNNGTICGKYKAFADAETVVFSELNERELL